MKKEVFIGLDHLFNVVVAHGGFTGDVFLAQALLQHVGRGLKVNHQVRRGQLLAEELVIAVINFQLRIAQIDVGEDLVFFKDVVGDDGLARLGPHFKPLQLLKAADKKGKLGLESGAALAFIKRAQKRIVLRLDYALRVQPVRDDVGQRALAHADGAFHCYILWWFKKLGHVLLINASQVADLTAAYMATGPLAMCNQLTAVESRCADTTKCLMAQSFGRELAQFKGSAEFGNWVNW